MNSKIAITLSALLAVAIAQRSPYAGNRPIGYPVIQPPTTPSTTTQAAQDDLGNRFGDENGTGSTGSTVSTTSTTTQRLPIEALGDRDLVNRLSKLPIDQQPFWFINWQALEAHRKNPQTYPQRGNPFSAGNIGNNFLMFQ